MATDTFVDSRPRSLASWRLTNDRSYRDRQNANIGTDFAGRDVPKMKFLFTVEFELGDELRGANLYAGSQDMASIRYACKTATRPNINVNYADVNSYNYRYKVATKVDYGTVSLTLYDDNKNLAHDLLMVYLNTISPVSNVPGGNAYYLSNNIQEWASLGPLPNAEAHGLIRKMRVSHHYTKNNSDDRSEYTAIHYDYINPKIQSFVFDDLDMSISEASMVSMTFVYDSVNVVYGNSDSTGAGTVEVGDVETVRLDGTG